MANVEVLEGCMCEYIPEDLRTQVEAIAEQTDVYNSQVVSVALRIGLAVIIGKSIELWPPDVKGSKMKQKKFSGKLSGAGL